MIFISISSLFQRVFTRIEYLILKRIWWNDLIFKRRRRKDFVISRIVFAMFFEFSKSIKMIKEFLVLYSM